MKTSPARDILPHSKSCSKQGRRVPKRRLRKKRLVENVKYLDTTPLLFPPRIRRGRKLKSQARCAYAKLFAEFSAGSLAVGIVLVVLIPFLRKLITDKAETPPVETPATALAAP
jgi:hypothetical protein